jgi:23S rRNA pseudouridine2605 synthase
MHPRYEIKKTYRVTLDAALKAKDRKALEQGVKLDDGLTYPSTIKDVKDYKVIDIVIHEGKNRIVRRMFAALGYDVKQLKRIRIGNLELGDLKVGTYRHMTKKDKETLLAKDLI